MDVAIVAFVENFETLASRYHAVKMEERSVEHSWIGLQQSSVGIGSASQTIGIVQKLVSS